MVQRSPITAQVLAMAHSFSASSACFTRTSICNQSWIMTDKRVRRVENELDGYPHVNRSLGYRGTV